MLCEAAAELGPMIAVVVNVVNGERRCLERPGLACVCPFCGEKETNSSLDYQQWVDAACSLACLLACLLVPTPVPARDGVVFSQSQFGFPRMEF